MSRYKHLVLPLAAGFMAIAGAASAQCAGSGVVTRIQGSDKDVSIQRGGARVANPRVLEVVCAGDVVRTSGGTVVTLSIDGVGPVKIDGARAYTVGPRKGKPGAAGNVYRAVSDQVMPDMKKLPWNVMTKDPVAPVRFAAPEGSVQIVSPGRNQLYVRLVDGIGPYKVELRNASGAVLKSAEAAEPAVTLTGLALTPGDYTLVGTAADGSTAEQRIKVAPGAPAPSPEYNELTDAELIVALQALEMARSDPAKWQLEATQVLAAAPKGEMDRERVFALIDDYGLNPPN